MKSSPPSSTRRSHSFKASSKRVAAFNVMTRFRRPRIEGRLCRRSRYSRAWRSSGQKGTKPPGIFSKPKTEDGFSVTDNAEFELAEQFALHTRKHCFVTGKAGTG